MRAEDLNTTSVVQILQSKFENYPEAKFHHTDKHINKVKGCTLPKFKASLLLLSLSHFNIRVNLKKRNLRIRPNSTSA